MNNKIEGIIIHWSASAKTTSVSDIRAWHLARGWRDIGYHRVILYPKLKIIDDLIWSDIVKTGRKLNNDLVLTPEEQGAHAKGFNNNHLAIVIVGNVDYKIHPLQEQALLNVCNIFLERYKLEKKDIKLHREVNSTECPGFQITKLMNSYRGIEA